VPAGVCFANLARRFWSLGELRSSLDARDVHVGGVLDTVGKLQAF